MKEPDRNKPDIPKDTDELAADAPRAKRDGDSKKEPDDAVIDYHPEPNPPHTTTGKFFTAPKFGAAGSGGLEIEPGLDVN